VFRVSADLNNKTSPHNDEQVTGRKICPHILVKLVWQIFPEEDDVRLDESAAGLATRNDVIKDGFLHPFLAVLLAKKQAIPSSVNILLLRTSGI
jgi:hypothetical protein